MNLVGSTTNGNITAGMLVDMTDTVTATGSIGQGNPAGLSAIIATGLSPATAFAIADRGSLGATVINGAAVMLRHASKGLVSVTDIAPARSGILLSSTGAADAAVSDQHVRTYHKTGTTWVIAEDRIVSNTHALGNTQQTVHVMSYSNVHWKRNPVLDALRHAARPSAAWIPLPPEGTTQGSAISTMSSWDRMSVPSKPSAMIACDDACVGGGGEALDPLRSEMRHHVSAKLHRPSMAQAQPSISSTSTGLPVRR